MARACFAQDRVSLKSTSYSLFSCLDQHLICTSEPFRQSIGPISVHPRSVQAVYSCFLLLFKLLVCLRVVITDYDVHYLAISFRNSMPLKWDHLRTSSSEGTFCLETGRRSTVNTLSKCILSSDLRTFTLNTTSNPYETQALCQTVGTER